MELHFLRSSDSKNNIFSSSSVCVRETLCNHRNSKTSCSKKIKFGTLYVHYMKMQPQTYYEDSYNKLCTKARKKVPVHYSV